MRPRARSKTRRRGQNLERTGRLGRHEVTASTKVILTDHARWQASRRGLDEATVLRVATSPEQVVPARKGREVRQSRVPF